MTFRQRVETTYADLRPDDLVIDKSGKAWPVADIEKGDPVAVSLVEFWLCDPGSKVKQHLMRKTPNDTVTVYRVPSHADEAAKLEAEFPVTLTNPEPINVTQEQLASVTGNFASMDEAVAAVEAIGGTVEAEVTAEEVDAAAAATDDAPVRLPAFESMTPLEARSHLYLVHGCYAADLKGRDELAQMHADAHRQHAEGKLQSKYVPHVHEEA